MSEEGLLPKYVSTSSWDAFPALVSTTPFNFDRFVSLCSKDSHILDIGCGYGRICQTLEERGYTNLTGIDSSEALLNRARSSLAHTDLKLADVRALPFANGQFDHAIALGVLDSLIQVEDLRLAVNECARVLKPGGYWFVNFYTRNASRYFDAKYEAGLAEFGQCRVFRSNSGLVYRHYSLAEFLSVADKAFDPIYCEFANFQSMNQVRMVSGHILVLQKPVYRSCFR